MNSTLKKLLAVGLFVLSCTAVRAQKIHQFSVQQAIEYSKQNSVQVKNALLDVLIQEQTNRDITSIALPQINGAASMTYFPNIPVTLIPGEITGAPAGTFVPVKFGTKWSSGANISLSQIVFDGQVFIALKARDASIDLQKTIANLTEEQIRANVYKVYYQLVVSKVQIELLDANIGRISKLRHDVQVMYDNGFTEKLDIDKLTVQQTNLETEKVRVETMISNGYSGLKLLIGMPIMDSLILTDSLDEAKLKEDALITSQYEYKDRKEYQIATLTNELNGLNLRRYKLSRLPSLVLAANYSKQAQRNEFDFFGRGDWFTSSYIGLQFQVPIFRGFSINSRVQKATLELQKSKNQEEAIKINIDKEVKDARNDFTTAIVTMDFQKKNMALAEKVYEQTKKKYEIGTGDATEINNAQVDLKVAQTNYLTALYTAIIAKIDLTKATGKL